MLPSARSKAAGYTVRRLVIVRGPGNINTAAAAAAAAAAVVCHRSRGAAPTCSKGLKPPARHRKFCAMLLVLVRGCLLGLAAQDICEVRRKNRDSVLLERDGHKPAFAAD